MNSLTDLRDEVDVVIGVDTHVHTHSAAVVDTATGGVLDQITVEATPEGNAELVEFANNHAMLRAWAIEGTGGHGADSAWRWPPPRGVPTWGRAIASRAARIASSGSDFAPVRRAARFGRSNSMTISDIASR